MIIYLRKSKIFISFIFSLLLTALLVGCGRMTIKETHYYAVPSDDNVNIFRLNVTGSTVLSDAKYQSGWYPTNAVDSLYGNVRTDGGAADLQARRDIEKLTHNAVLEATKAYNVVALNPKSTNTELQKAMQVRRRVLSYPSLTEHVPASSRIIDYNPSLGVAVRHSDEKMVFILSANPDVVVGNIKNFAESHKTALAVSNLAKVTSQRVRNEVVTEEAREVIDKGAILAQFEESIMLLTDQQQLNGTDQIIEHMSVLLEFLEGVE